MNSCQNSVHKLLDGTRNNLPIFGSSKTLESNRISIVPLQVKVVIFWLIFLLTTLFYWDNHFWFFSRLIKMKFRFQTLNHFMSFRRAWIRLADVLPYPRDSPEFDDSVRRLYRHCRLDRLKSIGRLNLKTNVAGPGRHHSRVCPGAEPSPQTVPGSPEDV